MAMEKRNVVSDELTPEISRVKDPEQVTKQASVVDSKPASILHAEEIAKGIKE